MPKFTLTWSNTLLLSNNNVIGQRALYRQKSVGGSWLTAGFTPANDLAKTATSVESPTVDVNKVWEFKVQSLCTVGGPADNTNGVQEVVVFSCLTPTVTKSFNSATASLNAAGTDISKAIFTLRKTSDSAIVYGPTTVTRSGDNITANTGATLNDNTTYYWETKLIAVVNSIEVTSGSCNSANFTTDLATCDPVTNLVATATEF
jgi:hypothetical protein